MSNLQIKRQNNHNMDEAVFLVAISNMALHHAALRRRHFALHERQLLSEHSENTMPL